MGNGFLSEVNIVNIHIHKEEFEDTKGVIRTHNSKDRQHHNGQKDKQRSTKHTHKTNLRVTPTSLKTGVNSCAPEG